MRPGPTRALPALFSTIFLPLLLTLGLLLTASLPVVGTPAQAGGDNGDGTSPAVGPSILVFADDPVHIPPSSHVDLALSRLGLAYTADYGDLALFEAHLAAGDWDLVVFANDATTPTTTVFDLLNQYVLGGGRLIIHTYAMADLADAPLWATLGVAHTGTNEVAPLESAAPMWWWDAGHLFFNSPESVPTFQDLSNPTTLVWPVQHTVSIAAGAVSLAGYAPTATPGASGLVSGNYGLTVFRGFVDLINSADLDSDGTPDGVELWTNLIANVLQAVAPPGPFAKSTPTNSATGLPASPTLSWGSSTGATGYEYCYDLVNNNACDTTWTSTGSSTSANLAGLSADTTYYWQVRAANTAGVTEANSGTWWRFRTAPLPGSFAKSSPANDATGLPASPTLSWGSSTGATGYEYCFDLVDNGDCDATWISTGGSTSANLAGLSADTTYYWQVRAANTAGVTEANSGTWWRFRTYSPVYVYLPMVLTSPSGD